jgi:hypothetical protein
MARILSRRANHVPLAEKDRQDLEVAVGPPDEKAFDIDIQRGLYLICVFSEGVGRVGCDYKMELSSQRTTCPPIVRLLSHFLCLTIKGLLSASAEIQGYF